MQDLSLDIVENLFRANGAFVAEGDAAAADGLLKLRHEASAGPMMLLHVAEMVASQGCLTMKQCDAIFARGIDAGNKNGACIDWNLISCPKSRDSGDLILPVTYTTLSAFSLY